MKKGGLSFGVIKILGYCGHCQTGINLATFDADLATLIVTDITLEMH